MNDATNLEERVRQVNPVPDPFDPPMSAATAATTLIDLEERKVAMQTTTTELTKRGPKRPLLIASSAAVVVILVGAGLLSILAASGDRPQVADDVQAEGFATSIDDVAGRWRASGFPWYIELTREGTHAYGVDETRLEENLTGKPDGVYRFEGSLVSIESSQCTVRDIAEPGLYRIRLLTPDVIQFEVVEETCEARRTSFAVDDTTFEPVTWSRVED